MDSLTKNINSLERELSISQINPMKIVGGICIVVLLIAVGYVVWMKPAALTEKDGQTLSWPRLIQFIIAVAIALLAVLWILWNLFMY